MADRPILDVNIDTGAFDEYKARFDDYSRAVAAIPGEWGKIGAAVQPVSGFLAKMDAALAAAGGNSAAIGKATGETAKAGTDLALLWTGVSRSAKFFSHDVITATQHLAHWTKLTAVFGGLLGAGGLFGIDRLAMRAAGQRQSARGLGVSTGEYSAFMVDAARLTSNPEGLLGSFSEGFYSQSAKLDFAAAFGSGVTDRMQGKDAASFFASILPDLKAKIDATPQNQLQNMLEYTHLSRRGIDLEMANRIKGMSRGEIADISSRLMRDAAAMGMPDAATRKLQDLETRLKAAGTIVETHLENKLSVLTPNLTSLTKGFEKFALEALKPDSAFDVVMKEAAGDIDWLSGKMEDQVFRTDMRTFAKDALAAGILIEGVAKAIGGAMAVSSAYGAWKIIGGALSWVPTAAAIGAVAAGTAAVMNKLMPQHPERLGQGREYENAGGSPTSPHPAQTEHRRRFGHPNLNEGEDERARQKRFHRGSSGPPMPAGVFPERVPAKPGSLSDRSAIWMGKASGSPAQAVDLAMAKIGETIDNSDIQRYISTGGHPDPGKAAWCAMFVGASLTKAGIRDSRSDVATSYENWGSAVDPHSGIRKGDVYVRTRGHRPGETGGHVGMLTGQTRFVHGREQVEMISGNSAHRVRKTWEPVGGTNMIRRATEGSPGPAGSARKRFLPHREHVSALGHHPASLTRSEEVVIENLAGTFVSIDQG